MCCRTNITPVRAMRIATIAPTRDATKVFMTGALSSSRRRSSATRLHQVPHAVPRHVPDERQHQDAQPRHDGNPPLLQEVTEVARGVGPQLRRGGGLAEAE